MSCKKKMKPEQNQIAEEFEEFQAEIDLLLRTDFSKGTASRQRVQRRLEDQWQSSSWWSFLRRGIFSEMQTRVALASSAFLLFGILNVSGVFGLPQHSLFVTPVPIMPAQIISITEDPATGTLLPASLLAKTTPQVAPSSGLLPATVLLPTPMPVPEPFGQ